MGTIALAILCLHVAAVLVVYKKLNRNSAIIMLCGAPLFVIFGPILQVLLYTFIDLEIILSRGILTEIPRAFVICLIVEGIPAFVTGLTYSVTFLYFRNYLLRRMRWQLFIEGASLGAVIGGIAYLMILHHWRAVLVGALSGGLCGGIFSWPSLNLIRDNGVA